MNAAVKMPHLVPEIRSIILDQHDDLTHLWNICRLVSTEFKQMVEHIFVTRYLSRITIHFPCEKNIYYRLPNGSFSYEKHRTRFHFLHVKDIDGKRKAVFASGQVGDDETAPMDCMTKPVQGVASLTMVDSPEHTLAVGRLMYDLHMPGLYADKNLERMEFDWTDYLSIFFAEEAIFRRILSELVYTHSYECPSISILTITTQESNAAQSSKSSPISSTDPTTTTISNETQDDINYLRIHYDSVQIRSDQNYSRPIIAKIAARQIRLRHFCAAFVEHPLVGDSGYMAEEGWSHEGGTSHVNSALKHRSHHWRSHV